MNYPTLFTLLVCFSAAPALLAQEKGIIELKSVAQTEQVVKQPDGTESRTRVPASRVVPGDEVIFVIEYRNIGEEAADQVVVTNPVPEHMTLTAGSATTEGATVRYSVDAGRTFAALEDLQVEAEGGLRPATTADINAIQWTLLAPLPPGESGAVSFRAVLQ